MINQKLNHSNVKQSYSNIYTLLIFSSNFDNKNINVRQRDMLKTFSIYFDVS